MFEVYNLVERKGSLGVKLLASFCLALGIVFTLLICTGNLIMATLAIIGYGLFYVFQFRMNKEFEYAYFDGECRFAKIMNKARRKKLQAFSIDEVVMIAPSGDRSVYKYENGEVAKIYDYTAGVKSEPYYVMIHKKGEALEMIRFQPEEDYLNAVCQKYAGKVIRRSAE